ncbi:MAG TPA: serine/threonine-protein kinase [Blastocatellia bacterium]|jgi:serine/threonine protein kinase|nr:serine/threonine-protein kinase [Blastocatellia bacterium]
MAHANLIGQVLDDKYLIERQLGKGGMGAVYLATHLGTDRPVALKVITPQLMANDEFVERFRREAKAAGRLRHPNVVNVTDFGFAPLGRDRLAYLVMEYLGGCTLSEILAEETHLDINWIVDILEQTCSAIDAAHRQGVIHRDLKPDNIWLEPNRRGGYTVKVLDFGLAKLGDATLAEEEADSRPGAQSSPFQRTPLDLADGRTHAIDGHVTQPGGGDFSETATRLQTANSTEEQQTQILAQHPMEGALAPETGKHILASEAAAVLLAEPEGAEEQTQLLEHRSQTPPATDSPSTHSLLASQTPSDDGLTRVGSILGTPLYMSPEQCRSEPLDARADIYSLGVIAYQMLAGQTPFAGDLHSVMQQHIEAPPPPLKEKRRKIPKKMAKLVMSALAKNPGDRPSSAAGFASALRANAEGIGALVRRAFALYSEHFMQFFRMSLLLNLPLIVFAIIPLIIELLKRETIISPLASRITEGAVGFATFIADLLIAAAITGVTIRLVTQLYLAPLRPINLRIAYAALKKRLRALVVTGVMASIISFLACILLVVPGIILFINYSLYAPVVMMENLKGRAALKRSTALVKRARFTVIAVLSVQFAMPRITALLAMALIGSFLKLWGIPHAPELAGRIVAVIIAVLNVLFIPLISTLTALLYLKTRQMGGETLKEALSQFEEEDTPRSKWQQRMREQLQSSGHNSR